MVPRDDPCPKRPGFGHSTVPGKWVCVHCDAVTFLESDPIARLRQQYLAGETHEESAALNADFAKLSAEQWHRAIIVRARVESGKVTDWPNAVPLSDDEKASLGRMTDQLIGLFRR